jgi:hypothetical protein
LTVNHLCGSSMRVMYITDPLSGNWDQGRLFNWYFRNASKWIFF